LPCDRHRGRTCISPIRMWRATPAPIKPSQPD